MQSDGPLAQGKALWQGITPLLAHHTTLHLAQAPRQVQSEDKLGQGWAVIQEQSLQFLGTYDGAA